MSTRNGPFPILVLSIGLVATGVGCHGNNQNSANQAQTQNAVATQAADESQDPAEQANLAPAANTTSGATQQQTAPPPPSEDQGYDYNAPEASEPVAYAPAPPPPLPDYDQPEAPGPDYIWTPGYWNYANTGYYWVPGAWVFAPYTGALWTPGYWGFYNGRYLWHRGYWGPHIGFYGGVNYGHGYTGVGYVGGYWDNDSFRYNTAVTRVNPAAIHNTYSHRVRVFTNRRISYNGGHGGISTRPLTAERVASRYEHHMAPLPVQTSHREQARKDRSQWVSQNHGHPRTTAASQALNEGRHAPAAMPANVREQVQHEHAEYSPAAHTRPAEPTRPSTYNQGRATPNHPAARNETHVAPRTESRPANHPATRNEAQPQPNHPTTRNEAQPQPNHPATRNEARPQPNHAPPHTQAHPQAPSTAHHATTHPAHPHAKKRPEARQNTNGHRSNQDERKQPKRNENNPQQ